METRERAKLLKQKALDIAKWLAKEPRRRTILQEHAETFSHVYERYLTALAEAVWQARRMIWLQNRGNKPGEAWKWVFLFNYEVAALEDKSGVDPYGLKTVPEGTSAMGFWAETLPFDPLGWIKYHYGPHLLHGEGPCDADSIPRQPTVEQGLMCKCALMAVIRDMAIDRADSDRLTPNDPWRWPEQVWSAIDVSNPTPLGEDDHDLKTNRILHAWEDVKAEVKLLEATRANESERPSNSYGTARLSMNTPDPADLVQAIDKLTALRAELVETQRIAQYGEDPARTETEGRRAEQFFEKLHHDLMTRQPCRPVESPPGFRAQIDALIHHGESHTRRETLEAVMGKIGHDCKDLPISILRRIQTEVIPAMWGQDSGEVVAGLTAGDLKGHVKAVESIKELELDKEIRVRTERVLREIDLILCPYQEFLQQEPDGESIPSRDSVSLVDALIHRYKRVLRRLEVRARQQPVEQTPEKQRNVKQKKPRQSRAKIAAGAASGKFQPWRNPGDTCFIIDQGENNTRLLFHFGEERKDLCLRSHSHALNLMTYLASGSLRSDEIKDKLSLGQTKPSKVVGRANEILNKRVAEKGFVGVPANTEFIRRDEYNSYISVLTIYPSIEDFEHSQVRQPPVYGGGEEELDAERDSCE